MIPREEYERLVSELEIQTEREIGYMVQLLQDRDQSKIPLYITQIEEVGAIRTAITKDLCGKLHQEEERVVEGDLGDIAEKTKQLIGYTINFYQNMHSEILKEVKRRGVNITVH